MNGRAVVLAGSLAVSIWTTAAPAQVMLQPTPRPIVTAENESWFLDGRPIVHAGNVYYPSGPRVNFNGNEMVRSGHFEGIPLYSRTTIEPYSLVFVPLPGGWMQPYERRRAGELADTVGSATPSFPVVRASEQAGMMGFLQAAAPPTQVGEVVDRIAAADAPPAPAGPPAATTGDEPPASIAALASARRPEGENGVYVDFQGRRYFAAGPAVRYDGRTFKQVGEYHGFAVFARQGRDSTVYIPPLPGPPGILTPYTIR